MADDDGWATVITAGEVPDGKPVRAESPWGPVLVFARSADVFAIGNTCTHQGAPLHRGPVDLRSGTPLATCPAHGSMFDMATGAVRRGPAMHAVAAYETRVVEDAVQIRPRDAG
jgi:nitrite reductase/ring-hydroxylating ferredoxin subunit